MQINLRDMGESVRRRADVAFFQFVGNRPRQKCGQRSSRLLARLHRNPRTEHQHAIARLHGPREPAPVVLAEQFLFTHPRRHPRIGESSSATAAQAMSHDDIAMPAMKYCAVNRSPTKRSFSKANVAL